MENPRDIFTIDARITPQEILNLSAPKWHIMPDTKAVMNKMSDAINDAIQPTALFKWYDLHEVKHQTIEGQNPISGRSIALTTGNFSPYFTQASRFMTAIYTLGPRIDALVHGLEKRGKAREAHFVYMGALAALTHTATHLTRVAENRAHEEGIGVSPPLSPGSIEGWELSGQQELCALFPLTDLGISQGDGGRLTPMNTLTVVIAIGPGFQASRVGSPCCLCRMGGRCTLACTNHTASVTPP